RAWVGKPAAFEVERGLWKKTAIVIAKTAVDAQENHGSKWYAGRSEHAANFFSVKHARPGRGFVKPNGFHARTFESGTVTHTLVNEPGIVAVFENCPNSLNFVAKRGRSPSFRQTGSETLEIVAGKIGYESVFSECFG